jgi:PadR family transcriptional regulator, regulatory protein PadR
VCPTRAGGAKVDRVRSAVYLATRYIIVASMTESTYYILASLYGERRHGYAILKEVERLSGGDVRLPVGTLYGALDRLLRAGLVAVDGEEIVDGRARRYYTVTGLGERELFEEADRLRRAARVVRRPAPREATS